MTKNKITEGNAFALNIRQAVWRTLGGVIQPLLASELVDVHLYVGIGSSKSTATEYNVTADGDTISAVMPATLKRGVYRTWMTALYQGREVASACECAFEIVAFDEHGIYAPERIDGQPCVYLQGASMTDPEIEQYKARLLELQQQRDQEVKALEEERKRIADIVVQLDGFATETKQDELAQQLVLIKQAISETAKASDIPTDYARNETLLANTMLLAEKASQSSVSDLANEMASRLAEVRASIDAITAIDSDIRAGKAALAENIRLKGVSSSETDTLIDMANEVLSISQQPITFVSSEEYEKQMFGAKTNTDVAYKQDGPKWNLYKVMTDLLNDGRFVTYSGIVLCEYNKGDYSTELINAGAGGAYYTSDGKLYTYDKAGENAHVWQDSMNGKSNRWVAYLFANAYSNYIIPSVELCPNSIHIGRNVGKIICTFEGNISEIVVTDGNKLSEIQIDKNAWNGSVVLRNVRTLENSNFVLNTQITSIFSDCEDFGCKNRNSNLKDNISSIILPNLKTISGGIYGLDYYSGAINTKLSYVQLGNADYDTNGIGETALGLFPCVITEQEMLYICGINSLSKTSIFAFTRSFTVNTNLKKLIIHGFKQGKIFAYAYCNADAYPSLTKLVIDSYIGGEVGLINGQAVNLVDIVVGNCTESLNISGWNPSSVLSTEEGIATINENIRNHIAANVTDRTDQESLTFTISTDLFNALEQETLNAFTAKNWNVAGA